MAARLRAGVIGCGIGGYHAYAYHRNPDIELVAACDINPAAFARLYERGQFPIGTVKEYSDHRQMLAEQKLDIVSVATPDQYHVEPTIDAANAGVAAVFCEKPIASSLEDADRMIEALERNGTKGLIDHTRSMEPAYTTVRDQIRDGYIGKLTRIHAYMGGKRAMLFRNGTHLLGTVGFFAEADPEWVLAALDRGFEDYGTEYRGQGGRDPALDPGCSMILEYANGVRAVVNASKSTPSGLFLDLFGTRGRISVGDRETVAWQCPPGVDEGPLTAQPITWPQGLASDLGLLLVPAVEHLVRMVRDGETPNSPPRAARGVLEIMMGALQSQAQGMRPVRLPLPRSA